MSSQAGTDRDLAEAESEIADLKRQLAEAHREYTERLGAATQRREAELASKQREIDNLHRTLSRVEHSVTWRLFQRVRGRVYGAIGERSVLGRLLGASLRAVGRLAFSEDRKLGEPIRLPRFDEPLASLIIPVYTDASLTRACLRAIARNTDGVPYEVIVVDDTADRQTKRLLRNVENAKVVVNARNQHFLRSVNRGVEAAQGRYLVLMNNDTEVQPGWLRALVHRAESTPDARIVAPKYVFPDGRLNEAGGILWKDGTGWQVGRGDDPQHHHYNHVREVDYGSAAALLVRTDFLREIGGFDERFAPAYYEDADLCFQARARGYRVMYEPTAVVVHKEGGTMGTDESTGHKRNQAINRHKFVEKWKDVLDSEHDENSPLHVRRRSDRSRGPHVLVIDHKVPTPDQDSGSVRMMGIVEAFVNLGCKVTFLPDIGIRPEPSTTQLQSIGVEVLYGSIDLHAELDSIAEGLRLVIASRPGVAARYTHVLREYCPEARIVYDTVDLHFLREERRAALDGGTRLRGKIQALRELELALIRATDATAVVSEEERAEVLKLEPDARVEVIPNVHDIATSVPPPDGRSGLLFIGGFQHPPNADAVLFLVQDVMPRVWKQLDDVTLTVVGSNLPPEIEALAQPRVEIAGWVPDVEPLLRSTRVMVAPLRYGAGMKGKVTQSLSVGLPVVTTSVGAAGLDGADGEAMLIADDPDGLAERIVRVYRDDELWLRLSSAGQRVIEQRASRRTVEAALKALLAA
jgi:GT2 family glycosyltransferase